MDDKRGDRLYRAVKLGHRIQKLLNRNVDSVISFADLEKFLVKYFVIASDSFADYESRGISTKRQRIILSMRFFSFLCAVRYMSSALVNSDFVSVQLMSDPHYLLGHKRINSLMLSAAIIIANLMIGSVHFILERNGKLVVLTLFNNIEHKHPDIYQLNSIFHRKFCLKKNFLTKYALNSMMFMPNVVLNVVYFYGLTVAAYLDPLKNFSLLSIIFWDFCTLIWLIDLLAICMGGFAYYFLCTLFHKYQFIQLDRTIRLCVTHRDLSGLEAAIVDHNKISVSTHKLNFMFKFLLFIVYKFVKVPLNGLLYISHADGTNIYARVVMAVLLFVCVSIVFTVTMMSASVAKWAHKSYNLMYGLTPVCKGSAKSCLMVQSFIERLSGPVIGFYCYDMFAINNHEFAQFVIGWITNYFLIIELVNNVVSLK